MGAGVQRQRSWPLEGVSAPQQPLSESQGLQEVGETGLYPAVGETGLCTEVIPSQAPPPGSLYPWPSQSRSSWGRGE